MGPDSGEFFFLSFFFSPRLCSPQMKGWHLKIIGLRFEGEHPFSNDSVLGFQGGGFLELFAAMKGGRIK